MAAGVEKVKEQIAKDFGAVEITSAHDPNIQETVLFFLEARRPFNVNVTREFDDDYASGQIKVDLSVLGKILRNSTEGKAKVTRQGIISN